MNHTNAQNSFCIDFHVSKSFILDIMSFNQDCNQDQAIL